MAYGSPNRVWTPWPTVWGANAPANAPAWAETALKNEIKRKNATAIQKIQNNQPLTSTEKNQLVHDTEAVKNTPGLTDTTKTQVIALQKTVTEGPLTKTEAQVIQKIVPDQTIKSSDERCFIATAAYGSNLEPQVNALRHFRDEALERNPMGHIMVRTYYTISPPIAQGIAKSDAMRKMVRGILAPLITTFGR
jgi:hypothetical protein